MDCKVYPMNRIEDEAVQKFLGEELEKGYIRESKSPYASSFFFVRKKDGKLRPVQDYRKINALTIQNQYPLPLITDLIRDLSNAHIYTKLDVRWGYNNVRICEGDEKKAAFKTRYGLFEPTVMYFGLTNSPAMSSSSTNLLAPLFAFTWTTSGSPLAQICWITNGPYTTFSKSLNSTISISNQRNASSTHLPWITWG